MDTEELEGGGKEETGQLSSGSTQNRRERTYSQAQSHEKGLRLQQQQHQPRNLHHPHQARLPLNRSEPGSAEGCSAYSQRDRLSNYRPKVSFHKILVPSHRHNTQVPRLANYTPACSNPRRWCSPMHPRSHTSHWHAFVPPVCRRHDRVVRAIIWWRKMSENDSAWKDRQLGQ
jgi:hypothetical protein